MRLAVFPFDNETADSAYEGIAGGIADETVSRLSTPERLAEFDTIGNAAILRRPRTFRDLRAVGRDLGVDYVVLAQLKRDDRGVRLIAHLIRVADEAHVWAQTFDRASFDLATQSEIAEAIAAAVAAKL
jgi:TolB-like protein